MRNEWIDKSFLFQNITNSESLKLISALDVEYKDYAKGEVIYQPDKFEKKIGFVVSGECRVEKIRNDSHGIPLNLLTSGDAFGIVAVFTGCEEFPTAIYANKDTKIAYFSKNSIEILMKKNHFISMNIIYFLANRIMFLNAKISSFSSDNVEQKTAIYLLELSRTTNSKTVKFNKKLAAQAINVGRTSLYRALDQLEADGYIKINENNIIINDLDGLERKTK